MKAAIQNGVIRIRGGSHSFREHGLFRKRHEEWKREEIEAVRVEVEEYRMRESVSFDHFIRVEPASESERQRFSRLGKDQIEWMVTTIQQHLDLDDGEQ